MRGPDKGEGRYAYFAQDVLRGLDDGRVGIGYQAADGWYRLRPNLHQGDFCSMPPRGHIQRFKQFVQHRFAAGIALFYHAYQRLRSIANKMRIFQPFQQHRNTDISQLICQQVYQCLARALRRRRCVREELHYINESFRRLTRQFHYKLTRTFLRQAIQGIQAAYQSGQDGRTELQQQRLRSRAALVVIQQVHQRGDCLLWVLEKVCGDDCSPIAVRMIDNIEQGRNNHMTRNAPCCLTHIGLHAAIWMKQIADQQLRRFWSLRHENISDVLRLRIAAPRIDCQQALAGEGRHAQQGAFNTQGDRRLLVSVQRGDKLVACCIAKIAQRINRSFVEQWVGTCKHTYQWGNRALILGLSKRIYQRQHQLLIYLL